MIDILMAIDRVSDVAVLILPKYSQQLRLMVRVYRWWLMCAGWVHPCDRRLTVAYSSERSTDGRNSATNIRSNEATPDRAVTGRPWVGKSAMQEVPGENGEREGNGGGAPPTVAEFSTRLVWPDAVRRSAMWNMICRSEKCERRRL